MNSTEDIGALRFGSIKMKADEGQHWNACRKEVEDAYAWTLEKVETKGNVHVLEWSSPRHTDQGDITDSLDHLTSEVAKAQIATRDTMSISNADLLKYSPAIAAASCNTVPDADLAHLVLLDAAPLYEGILPGLYKENFYVKLTVNASALPEGTKTMVVTVKYVLPERDPKFHTLQLPVADADPATTATSTTMSASTTAAPARDVATSI